LQLLVVDDEERLARVLAQSLLPDAVTIATSGRAALELAIAHALRLHPV